MDSMQAFALGKAKRGKTLRVFDWDCAALLIRERKATHASAGLSGDWEWTGGNIFADGEIVPRDKTYTFLASTWATPEIEIDGELMDCWRYRQGDNGWAAETYWPESAIAILNAKP